MSDPVPATDPNAPPATDPSVAHPPSPDIEGAINEVVSQLKRGAESIASAVPSAPRAPANSPEAVLEELEKAGQKGAAEYTKALAEKVLTPMQLGYVSQMAAMNRRVAEADPEIGPLMRKYGKQVDEHVRKHGIGDAYLAQYGYSAIAKSVAADDPAYVEEKARVRADAMIAEWKAKNPTTKPPAGPAVETVHAGPVGTPPSATPSEEDAIKSIEVSRAEEELARRVWRMTPNDVRKQRYEIAKAVEKYGEFGLREIGGTPICSFADMRAGGTPENPIPFPVQED